MHQEGFSEEVTSELLADQGAGIVFQEVIDEERSRCLERDSKAYQDEAVSRNLSGTLGVKREPIGRETS